jgi:pyridoxamine 5'-phosphate oxidase
VGTSAAARFLTVDARDLNDLRREYAVGGLSEEDLEPAPVAMFRRWMLDAVRAGLYEPNAMVVSTADADGRPASRIVLLKGLSEQGFVFFTNYSSRKGEELTGNARAALLFPWQQLERQVRVEGPVLRLDEAENDDYFASRPRSAQIGAWASPQSQVVPDRATLDRRYEEMARRFGDGEVPRPSHWGGYRVEPDAVEFWQGRAGRMHDRLRYRRGRDGGWLTDRLAP